MAKKLPKITPKQKRFIKEYLKDLDAAKAVRRAGYNCSKENSGKIGYQLLENTRLTPHLEKAIEEHEYRIQVEQEDIIEEISALAFEGDIADFLEVHNGRALTIKSLDQLTKEQRKCVQSLKETPQGIEVRLYDKLKALDMLAKWKKLYVDSQAFSGDINVVLDKQDSEL